MKPRLYQSVVALLVVCGCADDRSVSSDGDTLRAHDTPLVADQVNKREIGEDCTTLGRSGCAGGVCLHVSTDPKRSHFCSKACDVTHDCPNDWACSQIPGIAKSYCIPANEWSARKASARTVTVPVNILPPNTLPPPWNGQIDGGRMPERKDVSAR